MSSNLHPGADFRDFEDQECEPWQIEQGKRCTCGGYDKYCPCQNTRFRNPGEQVGDQNLRRVRKWFAAHLCGTRTECAEDLGLSIMAVSRHSRSIRAEWRGKPI